MSEVEHHTTPDGDQFTICRVRALDTDLMFSGAEYQFSVDADSGESGFEVVIRVAPIFFHLLTLEDRADLPNRAAAFVARLLDEGLRERTEIRVTSDGSVMHGDRRLDHFLLAA